MNHRLRGETGEELSRLLEIYEKANRQRLIAKYDLSQITITDDILEGLYDKTSLLAKRGEMDKKIQEAVDSKSDTTLTLNTTTRSIYEMNEEILQLSSTRTDYMELEKQT